MNFNQSYCPPLCIYAVTYKLHHISHDGKSLGIYLELNHNSFSKKTCFPFQTLVLQILTSGIKLTGKFVLDLVSQSVSQLVKLVRYLVVSYFWLFPVLGSAYLCHFSRDRETKGEKNRTLQWMYSPSYTRKLMLLMALPSFVFFSNRTCHTCLQLFSNPFKISQDQSYHFF